MTTAGKKSLLRSAIPRAGGTLALAAVSLEDLDNFPPGTQCEKAISESRAYEAKFREAAKAATDEKVRKRCLATAEATKGLRKVWVDLQTAHDAEKQKARRLEALRSVKKFIGKDAYADGRMPSWKAAELLAPPKD